jgi:hypothetical protein
MAAARRIHCPSSRLRQAGQIEPRKPYHTSGLPGLKRRLSTQSGQWIGLLVSDVIRPLAVRRIIAVTRRSLVSCSTRQQTIATNSVYLGYPWHYLACLARRRCRQGLCRQHWASVRRRKTNSLLTTRANACAAWEAPELNRTRLALSRKKTAVIAELASEKKCYRRLFEFRGHPETCNRSTES